MLDVFSQAEMWHEAMASGFKAAMECDSKAKEVVGWWDGGMAGEWMARYDKI